jgi:hypothetical protein
MISTPIKCLKCEEIIDIDAEQQNSDKDIICTETSETFLCDDLPKNNTGVDDG